MFGKELEVGIHSPSLGNVIDMNQAREAILSLKSRLNVMLTEAGLTAEEVSMLPDMVVDLQECLDKANAALKAVSSCV